MPDVQYVCVACEQPFTRPVVRGRQPRLCSGCYERFRANGLRALPCEWCGVMGRRSGGQFCSRTCAQHCRAKPTCELRWLKCRACGTWFCRRPDSARLQTCSMECTVVASTPPARAERECRRCGLLYTPAQETQLACSRRCQRKDAKLRRKVRECGSYGEWRWSDFMRIARKFGYCCAYCGVKPDRLDPDHVIALANHGPNTTSNLLPACPDCNCDKSALTLTEWAATRIARGLPPVRTTWPVEQVDHLTAFDYSR